MFHCQLGEDRSDGRTLTIDFGQIVADEGTVLSFLCFLRLVLPANGKLTAILWN
jgi:hypothetical protein